MSEHSISLDSIITRHFKDKAEGYLDVIKLLRISNIDICLINLPINVSYDSNPNDLDIVINEIAFNKCITKLEDNNFIKTNLFVDTHQIVYSKKSKNESYIVNIHIHKNICFHGIKIFDFTSLKNNSKRLEDRLYYPSYYFEKEILLFESFYRNKINYRDKINLFKDNNEIYTRRKYLYKYVKYFYNKNISNRFIRYCSILTSLNYFLGFFKYLCIYIADIFSRILARRGTLVFYLGVDGSGKTTQCDRLNISLNKRGFQSSSVYLGLKVTLPQKLKSYFSNKNNFAIVTNNKKNSLGIIKKIKSNILDLIYLVNYIILFRLSYIKLRSCRSVVIIDRCHLDLIYRLNFFSKMLYRLILPSPDFVFALEGSLKEIAARKDEYSEKDTRLLNNNIQDAINYLENNKKTKILKLNTTKQSVEDISDLTIEYIIKNIS